MANKRDTSKQKRARQNRAQHAALEARTQKAGEPARPSRTAPTTKGKATRSSGSTSGSDSNSGSEKPSGGFFARARAQRPPRLGDTPVDLDDLQGSWFANRLAVPGGRQILTAGVLTIVLTAMMAFWKFPPEDDPDGKATETLFDLLGGLAIPVLLVPLLVMAAAIYFTMSTKRRGVWIGASFILALQVLMGFAVYLFPTGMLIFAVWKANRVEGPLRQPARAAEDEPADDGGPVDDDTD